MKNNTMKKLLALLLALVLTLALAACGKEENKTDDQTNDPVTDQDNAADEKVTLPVADGAVIGQGAVALHCGGAGCGRQDRHLYRQHR